MKIFRQPMWFLGPWKGVKGRLKHMRSLIKSKDLGISRFFLRQSYVLSYASSELTSASKGAFRRSNN